MYILLNILYTSLKSLQDWSLFTWSFMLLKHKSFCFY